MAVVDIWEEIARTPEQLAEERGVRAQIVNWAGWAVGAHYLKGCFGNFPGAGDDVKKPPRELKLTEELGWDKFAIHTAEREGLRCTGRYYAEEVRFTGARFCLTDAERRHPHYRSLQEYVRGLEGESPDQYRSWENTGFYPRREREGGPIYIGEDCRGRMHFDCIGLVDWVLTKTFNVQFDCGIGHFYGGSGPSNVDTYHGSPPQGELEPGDILVSSPSHIALVVTRTQLIHAVGERWGVRLTPLSFGERPFSSYNALCRLRRSFLRQRGHLVRCLASVA